MKKRKKITNIKKIKKTKIQYFKSIPLNLLKQLIVSRLDVRSKVSLFATCKLFENERMDLNSRWNDITKCVGTKITTSFISRFPTY